MTNTSVFIFLTVFLLFLSVGLVIYVQRLQTRFSLQKEDLSLKAQEAWRLSEKEIQSSKLLQQELEFASEKLLATNQTLNDLTKDHEQYDDYQVNHCKLDHDQGDD